MGRALKSARSQAKPRARCPSRTKPKLQPRLAGPCYVAAPGRRGVAKDHGAARLRSRGNGTSKRARYSGATPVKIFSLVTRLGTQVILWLDDHAPDGTCQASVIAGLIAAPLVSPLIGKLMKRAKVLQDYGLPTSAVGIAGWACASVRTGLGALRRSVK